MFCFPPRFSKVARRQVGAFFGEFSVVFSVVFSDAFFFHDAFCHAF